MEIGGGGSYICDGYKEILPYKADYFKDFIADGVIEIDKCKDNIKAVLSVKSNMDIEKVELCDTSIDLIVGNALYNCRVVRAEVKISFQVKYIGGKDGKSVFVESSKFFKNIYIPVSNTINNYKLTDIFRKNKYVATSYVEDIQTLPIQCRKMKFCIIGLISLNFILPHGYKCTNDTQ